MSEGFSKVAPRGGFGPDFGEFWPSWAICWSIWANFGHDLTNFSQPRPMLANFAQSWPQLGHCCPNFAEFGRMFATHLQHRPNNGPHMPDLAEFGPKPSCRSNFRAHLCCLRPNFGQVRPNMASASSKEDRYHIFVIPVRAQFPVRESWGGAEGRE